MAALPIPELQTEEILYVPPAKMEHSVCINAETYCSVSMANCTASDTENSTLTDQTILATICPRIIHCPIQFMASLQRTTARDLALGRGRDCHSPAPLGFSFILTRLMCV